MGSRFVGSARDPAAAREERRDRLEADPDAEARGLFDQLTSGATPAGRSYGGSQQMDLPGGGWVGLRQSEKFGTTLDIDVPWIPFNKVHFK